MKKGLIPRFGYPYKAMIEPVNFCDFRCPLCPTGNGSLGFEKKVMAFDTFKKTVEPIKKYLIYANLWGYGEPLLHPELCKMAQYLAKNKIRPIISTNASQIKSYKMAEMLFKNGFRMIIVAMDGFSQETYEQYRINGSFEHTKKALLWLKKASETITKYQVEVVLQFIVMKHNEHEIDAVKSFAEKEHIRLKLKSVNAHKSDREQFVPSISHVNRYKRNDNNNVKGCPFMWQHVTINSDGTMDTCCKDPHREMIIGNVNDMSVIKLWKSEKFNKYRKAYLKDKCLINRCSKCVLSF
jgi:radical SAM protein with 4Fe4S-binding SPASM domain